MRPRASRLHARVVRLVMGERGGGGACSLNDTIADKRDKLNKVPEDLEALKAIMRLVAEIREKTPEMEERFTLVEEQWRTLHMFAYPYEVAPPLSLPTPCLASLPLRPLWAAGDDEGDVHGRARAVVRPRRRGAPARSSSSPLCVRAR